MRKLLVSAVQARDAGWPGCAPPAIAKKSPAARLAPPTKAPPTSGKASSAPAFDGFTDPP